MSRRTRWVFCVITYSANSEFSAPPPLSYEREGCAVEHPWGQEATKIHDDGRVTVLWKAWVTE